MTKVLIMKKFLEEGDLTYIHSTPTMHNELFHSPNNSLHPSKVHAYLLHGTCKI